MDTPSEPLVGGSYLVKDGVRTLVEEPTRDHPEGNRARDEKGAPVPGPTELDKNPPPEAAAGEHAPRRRPRTTEGAV